jgi:tRNA U54 and U55 pseudouridine synthase Pus10
MIETRHNFHRLLTILIYHRTFAPRAVEEQEDQLLIRLEELSSIHKRTPSRLKQDLARLHRMGFITRLSYPNKGWATISLANPKELVRETD